MKLWLHHVNVTSDDLGTLSNFYTDALGLAEVPSPPMIATSRSEGTDVSGDQEWETRARFYDAGDATDLQVHATQRQPYLALTEGHTVNPLIGGHFALRTDDIQAVMQRLKEHNIPFDDWGIWSVEGWYQIFLTDPAGNMIEIHQVMDSDDESDNH